MRTELVEKLAAEYLADPNCRAELWIASEGLTDDERVLFFKIIWS